MTWPRVAIAVAGAADGLQSLTVMYGKNGGDPLPGTRYPYPNTPWDWHL